MKKILWFRRDLRIEDSMLLAQSGEVLPIFIFDKTILDPLDKKDRRVSFLFHTVLKLKADLQALGLDLALFYSTPTDVFTKLLPFGFDGVYASVDYDSYARERDEKISQMIPFYPLNDCYIFEPEEVLKRDQTPYLVFTPYYKAAKELYTQFHALSYTKGEQSLFPFDYTHQISLTSMGFLEVSLAPESPQSKLKVLGSKLSHYAVDRDFLALDATSHLSIALRFGTVSIREVLRTLISFKKKGLPTEPFFRQLIFRDFYAYLLYHFPSLAWKNYKYDTPTKINESHLKAFYTAQTGYPLIDAGIQELLQTGDMHNRVRMVVGSFFTKHLMLPWQKGEAFFAKHLMDYDASANILSWQWCAGTGIDPQPYFRIFNPYSQSKKFDKEAIYIKKHLPQLRDIPAKFLHDEPFLLSHVIKDYPKPIVKHDEARKAFLANFK